MLRNFTVLSICLFYLPISAWSQDSPLDLFPANVDIVARLKEPDKSTENIVALVNAIQPGVGEMARGAINDNLGKAISNPTLTGVDMTKDWYLGVFSQGRDEPLVVFAIPAIDPEELVAAVKDNANTSVKGNWVFYTDRGDVPALASGGNSIGKGMNPSAAEVFKMGELGFYVNVDHLTEVYGEELETGYEQVLDTLNNIRFAIPQNSGVNLGPIFEVYGTVVEKFYQSVRDSNSFTAAISLNKEGIKIEEYVVFEDGSESSEMIEKFPTKPIADLSKLPKGAVLYYGVSGGVKELTKWGTKLSAGMTDDETKKQRMDEALAQLDDIELGTMAASMSVGNAETGLLRVAAIGESSPVEKYRDYMRSLIAAMNEIELPGITQTSTIDEDAETYGDLKADVVTISQEYDPNLPGIEIQEQFQQQLFGPDGIQSRVVYLDDHYLSIMGGGQASAKAFVEGYQAGNQNGIAASRSGLMKEVNLIALVDAASGIANILKAVTTLEGLPPIPIDAQMIDNLFLTSSYLGFAVAAEENAIRCRTELPVAQMQNIAKLAMMLAPLAAGAQF